MAAMLAAGAAMLVGLFRGNPRLLGSWHGFLHAGIAESFAHSFPPENPFFAGAPLPYYWFYHFTGYWLSRGLHLNLLLTFQLVSWASLGVLIVAAGMLGRRYFGTALAGAAVAYLALCGVDPLGPGIAVAKKLTRGAPLLERVAAPVETTFVSNAESDRLMTEPLLGAMYLWDDWRQGQDLVWFFDIGSRAPALAGLMVLLYLLLKPEWDWRRMAVLAAISALVTALNPLVGLAAAGALGVGTAAMALRRRSWTPLTLSIACGAGAVLAAPTYYQMFFRVSGGSGFGLRSAWGLPITSLNYLVLAPLAVLGARKAGNSMVAAAAIAGCVLLVMMTVIHLPEGNEHNLGNTAQCLLAVPAGAWVAGRAKARAALVFAVFLPVTAATLMAYADRPPMPIAWNAPEMTRTGGDLQEFYEWARRDTAPNSIFIVDPGRPVKMSGNASELPAFTARTLFTDLPNYLTTPNRDAAFRGQVASDLTAGRLLDAREHEYLQRFTRPLYVVTYRGGDLAGLYGPPVYQQGMVTAYRLVERQARR